MTVEIPLFRPARRRAILLTATLGTLLMLGGVPALAETPAPSAPTPGTPAADAAATPPGPPVATPMATPTPVPGSPTIPSQASSAAGEATGSPAEPAPATSAPPAPEVPPPARGRSRAVTNAEGQALGLAVRSTGGPVAGRFFEDLGRFSFNGNAAALPEGTAVVIYRRAAGSAGWAQATRTTLKRGRYNASLPVQARGGYVFSATTGGAPGSGDEVASPPVGVTVADSTVSLHRPGAKGVDSLATPRLSGSVVPARAGVVVHLDVRRGSAFRLHSRATTDAKGRFRASFSHGRGTLASYTVRATHRATNRKRFEIGGNRTVRRVAVLNAVVTKTTAAQVAKTYRKGCPVGPSRLRTITMNYYGRDKRMHRGVLIIRTDLVPEITAAFRRALGARYPFAKMNNPNVYGGNDPRQMAANNTSGFNCRKVVGNPYAQSPHSYGTAIDVNTVQNPYRDRTGRWWPSNGKSYIDRTPLRFGMLSRSSALTRQLRNDGFFWGGLWSPGRDYQHFQYQR